MLIIDMQTRPFLIIPACVFERSRNRGGGLEHRKINLPQKYQIIHFFFLLFPLSCNISPFPAAFSLPIAAVPASPSLPQCTWSAVLCSHPHHGGGSSVDGPGESRSGRSRDVGSGAEGEGQAVSRAGAHCI